MFQLLRLHNVKLEVKKVLNEEAIKKSRAKWEIQLLLQVASLTGAHIQLQDPTGPDNGS
jgi:hypothetical protein